jgi:hypothetical protein
MFQTTMFAGAPRLALRSPFALPKHHPQTSIDSGNDESGRSDERNAAFLPWICALQAAGEVLDLSVETQFTASVLLHRYRSLAGAFRVHNEKTVDRTLRQDRNNDCSPSSEILAVAACLFVACKVEDEPRRLGDVVNCALQLRVRVPSYKMDEKSSTMAFSMTRNVPVRIMWDPTPGREQYSDSIYKRAHQGVVDAQQVLLRWLGFDVQVSHPHRMVVLIVQYVASIWMDRNGDDDRFPDSFQTLIDQWRLDAWQRLNTAVFCADCLQHNVASLACASMDIELPSLAASPAQCPSVHFGCDSANVQRFVLLLQEDWYLAIPGVSKESVTAARLDLERICLSFT